MKRIAAMGVRTGVGAVQFCALLLMASAVAADDSKGALTIALENDLFGAGKDAHYTHGAEITYVSDTYQPNWMRALAGGAGLFGEGEDMRTVFTLGQQMFTPGDISRSDLVVDDRPYAGWLYASFGMLIDSQQSTPIRSIDKLELIVGLIGPQTRAEQTQRGLHRMLDSDDPKGWDNQLHNETTVDAQYQREWIVPLVGNYVDVVPRFSASYGTAQRNVGAGFTMRVGSGLNADAGPPLIRPTAAGSHYFVTTKGFYWYLFAGAHGRYVGQNIFLDGNDDGRSHHVDKKYWVGEVQGGLVLGWENWRLTATEIYRSREFEGQQEPDEFGSIAVSYRF